MSQKMHLGQPGVSIYEGTIVYDKELYRYLGSETYCRLRRQDPSLYMEFVECEKIPCQPAQVEAILLDFNMDSRQIKEKVLASYVYGFHQHSLTSDLVDPCECKIYDFEPSQRAQFWWVFWVVLVVISIVWFFVRAGFIDFIQNDCYFSTFRNPPSYVATRWL